MSYNEMLYAYARGYYDGRVEGVENNPFEDDESRASYSNGYERGVSDYCEETHCDEV